MPELLGQTLLEAMACATPVICTAVASMPELVEDGVNGLIVPPNDPAALRTRINWLLEHPQEAAAMGQPAQSIGGVYLAGGGRSLSGNLLRGRMTG